MKFTGVFGEDLPKAIGAVVASDGDINQAMEELLEMLIFSKTKNTNYLRHDASLYEQNIAGDDFATWLYSYSHPADELRDNKRELELELKRAVTYSDMPNSILSTPDTFSVGKQSMYKSAWGIFDFLRLKQERLKKITSKDEFLKEMSDCYKNIFFDESVPASVNSLETSFINIKGQIVDHLRALDCFHMDFKSHLKKGCSFRELSHHFTDKMGIPCSPQASRSDVKILKRTFTNSKTNKPEEIVCEMHTKFSGFNRGRKGASDRLYFHPGKKYIKDGRIVVVYIGEHL